MKTTLKDKKKFDKKVKMAINLVRDVTNKIKGCDTKKDN